MSALPALGCSVKVTGFIASAENAISGNSFRPGDVIRHYGGRTTEVTKTDAEGRLVLADAMAYAVSQVKPVGLVDIATLTGAQKEGVVLRNGASLANAEAPARLI